MEILEIPLTKIRPDKNQPRKSFDHDKLESLAETIKTTGVINPIEIDKSYMIITGENRWRATKLAGLKTIPVKVFDISNNERFLRQVIENIQSQNLTDYELALAFKKLLNTPGVLKRTGERYNGETELAKKIGMSKSYVEEHLDLLEASKSMQKAIKKGLPFTNLRAITQTPEKHKKKLEQRILSGEFRSRDAAVEIAQALNRSPEKAKEILAKDYSKYKSAQEVGHAVRKISPDDADYIEAGMKPPEELNQISLRLRSWCQRNTPQSVGKFHHFQIMTAMIAMREDIDNWTKNKQSTKVLTIKSK